MASTSTSTAVDPTGQFDYSGCKQVVVTDHDSLLSIAQANHVGLQQLRYFNHINKVTFKIRVGQTIYIPSGFVYIPVGQ